MRPATVLALIVASAPARAAQPRDLSGYYGSERATLGAWFGKLAFGGIDAPKLPSPEAGVVVELVRNGKRIDGVDITIPADSCDDLHSRLVNAWGPPNGESRSYGETWSSKSGTQGAVFEGNSGFDLPCRLRFFRRVSAQQWLSGSKQSVVPTWAIGRPAAELEATIAVLEPQHHDDGIHWEDTAIDGLRVTLTAEVSGKQVVSVVVGTNIESSSKVVWQRVVAVYGKPDSASTHEDTVSWRWRRSPGIEVRTFVGDAPTAPVPGAASRPRPTPAEPSAFPLSISFGVH